MKKISRLFPLILCTVSVHAAPQWSCPKCTADQIKPIFEKYAKGDALTQMLSTFERNLNKGILNALGFARTCHAAGIEGSIGTEGYRKCESFVLEMWELATSIKGSAGSSLAKMSQCEADVRAELIQKGEMTPGSIVDALKKSCEFDDADSYLFKGVKVSGSQAMALAGLLGRKQCRVDQLNGILVCENKYAYIFDGLDNNNKLTTERANNIAKGVCAVANKTSKNNRDMISFNDAIKGCPTPQIVADCTEYQNLLQRVNPLLVAREQKDIGQGYCVASVKQAKKKACDGVTLTMDEKTYANESKRINEAIALVKKNNPELTCSAEDFKNPDDTYTLMCFDSNRCEDFHFKFKYISCDSGYEYTKYMKDGLDHYKCKQDKQPTNACATPVDMDMKRKSYANESMTISQAIAKVRQDNPGLDCSIEDFKNPDDTYTLSCHDISGACSYGFRFKQISCDEGYKYAGFIAEDDVEHFMCIKSSEEKVVVKNVRPIRIRRKVSYQEALDLIKVRDHENIDYALENCEEPVRNDHVEHYILCHDKDNDYKFLFDRILTDEEEVDRLIEKDGDRNTKITKFAKEQYDVDLYKKPANAKEYAAWKSMFNTSGSDDESRDIRFVVQRQAKELGIYKDLAQDVCKDKGKYWDENERAYQGMEIGCIGVKVEASKPAEAAPKAEDKKLDVNKGATQKEAVKPASNTSGSAKAELAKKIETIVAGLLPNENWCKNASKSCGFQANFVNTTEGQSEVGRLKQDLSGVGCRLSTERNGCEKEQNKECWVLAWQCPDNMEVHGTVYIRKNDQPVQKTETVRLTNDPCDGLNENVMQTLCERYNNTLKNAPAQRGNVYSLESMARGECYRKYGYELDLGGCRKKK